MPILFQTHIILDKYITGTVKRISQEAPIPILLHDQAVSYNLGGAGNVAINLHNLGIETHLSGITGYDTSGSTVQNMIITSGLRNRTFNCSRYITPTKTRIISKGQQILRIDEEQILPVNQTEVYTSILDDLLPYLDQFNIIILSDYGKAMFFETDLAQHLIQNANKNNIKVIVDPKGEKWERFQGAFCLTPNKYEMGPLEVAPVSLPGQTPLV